MAYKTKHKRKYIKRSKKLYGGLKNSSSLDQQQLVGYAASKALNNNLPLEYSELLKNPVVNKMGSRVMDRERDPNSKPTIASNLELILKLIALEGNHLTEIFIQNIAKELNIDLNQSADQIVSQLKGKITLILDILKSKQGEVFVAELEEVFNEGLSVFKPIAYQTLDEFNDALRKELKVLVRIANEAATEFPPFFLAEELMNLLSTLIILLTSAAKIFPPIADALEKIENFKKNVTNMQGNFNKLVNQETNKLMIENNPRPIINNTRPIINNPGQITSRQIQPTINNMNDIDGGSLMKKLMKERKLIGGSIAKSRADFLNPNLTLSQLIKPHNNKSKKRSKR